MKTKEIELKFLITKEQKKKIYDALSRTTKYIGAIRQVDTYYIPTFKDYEIDGQTMEALRIREVDGKKTLCYKKIHREANPVYCDEYETEIESKESMEKILFALGFSVQMVIDKTRESFVADEMEFDFDSVLDVAEILEIEIIGDNVSVDDIYEFVKPYGLSEKDVTYDGIQKIVKDKNKKNRRVV